MERKQNVIQFRNERAPIGFTGNMISSFHFVFYFSSFISYFIFFYLCRFHGTSIMYSSIFFFLINELLVDYFSMVRCANVSIDVDIVELETNFFSLGDYFKTVNKTMNEIHWSAFYVKLTNVFIVC